MEGKCFHSKVKKTFVNGNLVYDEGIVDYDNRGEMLVFER